MKRRTARKNLRRREKLTILATVFILAGLTVLAFPYAATWWSATRQYEQTLHYMTLVNEGTDDQFQTVLAKNTAGNPAEALAAMTVQGSQAIGSVVIPSVGIDVPFYPTSTPENLSRGAGHVLGTSAPVGGKGTHAALSAHTGMPTATMFDRLKEVEVGDTVIVRTLGHLLEYQVRGIVVDTPEDGAARLQPDGSRDLLTLITCTPYGVNTHRLLVTAERAGDATALEPIPANFAAVTPVGTPTWALAYGTGVTGILTASTWSVVTSRRNMRRWLHSRPFNRIAATTRT